MSVFNIPQQNGGVYATSLTGAETFEVVAGGVNKPALVSLLPSLMFGNFLAPSGDASGATDTAAINAIVSTWTATVGTKQTLLLGPGIFYLNGTITIPQCAGFRIWGSGREATVLNMVPNNTPIFTFLGNLTNAFDMGHFTMQWTNNQTPAADPYSIGFYPNSGAGNNVFECSFTNFYFANGSYAVGTNPGIQSVSQNTGTGVWTTAAQNLYVGQAVQLLSPAPGNFSTGTKYYVLAAGLSSTTCELSATLNGSVIIPSSSVSTYLISAPNVWGITIEKFTCGGLAGALVAAFSAAAGQPCWTIRDGLISCPNPAAASAIALSAVDCCLLENVEFDGGVYPSNIPQISIGTSAYVTFINVKWEAGNIAGSAGSGSAAWSFPNATVLLIGCKCLSLTVTGSSVNATFINLPNAPAQGNVSIMGLSVAGIGAGNILYAYNAAGGAKISTVENTQLFGTAVAAPATSALPAYNVDAGTHGSAVTVAGGVALPASGATTCGVLVSATANLGMFFGTGAPTFSAAEGSMYSNTTGSAGARLYVNTSAGSGTTWTAAASP